MLQAVETSTLKSPCYQVPQKENSYSLWSGTMMGPGHSLIQFPLLGVDGWGNGQDCSLSGKSEHWEEGSGPQKQQGAKEQAAGLWAVGGCLVMGLEGLRQNRFAWSFSSLHLITPGRLPSPKVAALWPAWHQTLSALPSCPLNSACPGPGCRATFVTGSLCDLE